VIPRQHRRAFRDQHRRCRAVTRVLRPGLWLEVLGVGTARILPDRGRGLAGARRAAGPPRAGPGPADDRVRVHLRGRLDRHDGAGRAGGTVVLDRSVIPGVGTRMFFADPDGNVFGAMQYDTAAE